MCDHSVLLWCITQSCSKRCCRKPGHTKHSAVSCELTLLVLAEVIIISLSRPLFWGNGTQNSPYSCAAVQMLSEAPDGFAVSEVKLCYLILAAQAGMCEQARLFSDFLGDFFVVDTGLVN